MRVPFEKEVLVESEVEIGIEQIIAALPQKSDMELIAPDGREYRHVLVDGFNSIYLFLTALKAEQYLVLPESGRELLVKVLLDAVKEIQGTLDEN